MSLSKKRKEGIEIPLNKRKKTLHYEANTRKLTSDLNSEIKVENEFDNLFEEEEADLTIKEALQDIKLDIFDEDLDGFGDELACQTERLGNCDHKSDTPSISVEKTSNMKKSPKVIKIIDKQKEALKLIQIALMKFESVTKDLQELVEFDIEEAEADLEDGLDSSSTVQIEVNDISPQYMDNCLKDSEAKVEDINEGSNPTIAQTKETKSQQKHHSISVSHSSETVCENEKQTSSPASLPNSQKNQKLIKKCSSTKNTCSKLPCVVLKNIMDEKSSSKFTKSCNEHDGIISDTDDNDASDNAPEDRSEAVISSLGENHLATLSSRIEDSQPSTSHESYDDEISGGCNFNPISEQNNETAKETSFEEEIPQTSFKIDGIEKPTEFASEDQIRGEGAVNIEPNPPQEILKDIESQSIKSENIDVSGIEITPDLQFDVSLANEKSDRSSGKAPFENLSNEASNFHQIQFSLPTFSPALGDYLQGKATQSRIHYYRKQFVSELSIYLNKNNYLVSKNKAEQNWGYKALEKAILTAYPNIHKDEGVKASYKRTGPLQWVISHLADRRRKRAIHKERKVLVCDDTPSYEAYNLLQTLPSKKWQTAQLKKALFITKSLRFELQEETLPDYLLVDSILCYEIGLRFGSTINSLIASAKMVIHKLRRIDILNTEGLIDYLSEGDQRIISATEINPFPGPYATLQNGGVIIHLPKDKKVYIPNCSSLRAVIILLGVYYYMLNLPYPHDFGQVLGFFQTILSNESFELQYRSIKFNNLIDCLASIKK